MKKVLICCSGGITSEILAQRLAALSDSEFTFDSVSEMFLFPKQKEYDLLLLAPQTQMTEEMLSQVRDEYRCFCYRIPGEIYASMEPQQFLDYVKEVIEPKPQEECSPGPARSLPAFVNRLSMNRRILHITRCMTILGGIFLGQSLFSLLLSLPLGPGYEQFLAASGLGAVLNIPVTVMSSVVSLFLCFLIASQEDAAAAGERLFLGLLSLCGFLLLLPFSVKYEETKTVVETVYLALDYLSYSGILVAVLTGLASAFFYNGIFAFLRKKKWPLLYVRAAGTLFVMLFFMSVRVMSEELLGRNVFQLAERLLDFVLPFFSGGVAGYALYVVLSTVLYFVGVHGPMTVYSVIVPLHTMISYANYGAFAQGLAAPYPEWFLTPWVFLGGCGGTFALNLLMLLRARSNYLKTLGKLSISMSVFNINEPLIFGLPIAFNPLMGIPFLLTPAVNLAVCMLCMRVLPLVPLPTEAEVSVYYPVGIGAMLTNHSIWGLFLSLGLIALDMILYYPFFKQLDCRFYEEECQNGRA